MKSVEEATHSHSTDEGNILLQTSEHSKEAHNYTHCIFKLNQSTQQRNHDLFSNQSTQLYTLILQYLGWVAANQMSNRLLEKSNS